MAEAIPISESSRKPGYAVILSGLMTTALALLGVYVLDAMWGVNIMGWYANVVIPVGAVLVGLAASLGYGLGSWLLSIRITRKLLLAVVALQLAAYFAAQVLIYLSQARQLGIPMGQALPHFHQYFDAVTRSIAFHSQHGSGMGPPLGAWGYGIRALEIVGFVGGSLVIPLVLRARPYCDDCQVYMRTRAVAVLPASVKARRVKKSDTAGRAAYEAQQELANAQGLARVEALNEAAEQGDAEAFHVVLTQEATAKEAQKLPQRIAVQLISCPLCHNGLLHSQLLVGHGKQLKKSTLARHPARPEFVRDWTGRL